MAIRTKRSRKKRPQDNARHRSFGELSVTLSGFEYALLVLLFGFSRWLENCMDAAGARGLSMLDIIVLHAVNHRARGRRVAEICMVLNIADSHLVSYALKKLVAAGLLKVTLKGRERHYETNEKGDEICLEHRRVREKYLVRGVEQLAAASEHLAQTGKFLQAMTAIYDQAGRTATADSHSAPLPPMVRTKK